VELVGDYPDTKVRITIQYSHHRGSKVRGYDFGIWGPEGRHNGMRDLTITPSPAFFAANVAGWAVEE
jgi:hypothetical protein